jgi:hypothetical protein
MKGEDKQHKEGKAEGSVVPSNRSEVVNVFEF